MPKNYNINEKSKTITVKGELTPIELTIIAGYIKSGYKVKEAKANTAYRMTKDDIFTFYDNLINAAKEAGDKATKEQKEAAEKAAKIKAEFSKKMTEKYTDSKGVKRNNGILKTLKWYKDTYTADYNSIGNANSDKWKEYKPEEKQNEE